MIRTHREEVSLSAADVVSASWRCLAVSLDSLLKIEDGQRHPGAFHLDALMVVLGLLEPQCEDLISRWAQHPRTPARWRGATLETWDQMLAAESAPIPRTRRLPRGAVGSTRLMSLHDVVVTPSFKMTFTTDEDALVRTVAARAGITVGGLVRQGILEAIGDEKDRWWTNGNVSVNGSGVVPKAVRVELSAEQLYAQRRVSGGAPLADWAKVVLLSGVLSGRIPSTPGFSAK